MSEGSTAQAWTVQSSETTTAADTTSPVELFFEDNFNSEQIPQSLASSDKKEFKKLDDSAQYLAVLEAKLQKIKNDPRVLAQLAARREQCMRELCTGSGPGALTDSQVSLDRPIGLFDDESKANDLVRRLKPEQPLSAGEVIPIVKHDVLQIRHDENELETEELTSVNAEVVLKSEDNQDNVSR